MVRIFKNIFLWLAGHFLAIAVVTLLILSIGPLVHYVKSSENQEASLKEDCLKWTKRIEYKTKELSSMRRLLWMKQRDILQKEVELELDPRDLRIDTFRSSGAGGQHINKTSSAIRVTHLPTGMVVECQDQRSQRENKDRALKVLRSRLLQQKQEAYDREYNARRQSQVGTGDRSEKIRTYNFPQDRVTDHRIALTLRNLQSILDGDLDRVVDPLILADQEQKLKQHQEGIQE